MYHRESDPTRPFKNCGAYASYVAQQRSRRAKQLASRILLYLLAKEVFSIIIIILLND